jgi:hypothetical protein
MSSGKDESISVWPIWILRVELQEVFYIFLDIKTSDLRTLKISDNLEAEPQVIQRTLKLKVLRLPLVL